MKIIKQVLLNMIEEPIHTVFELALLYLNNNLIFFTVKYILKIYLIQIMLYHCSQ